MPAAQNEARRICIASICLHQVPASSLRVAVDAGVVLNSVANRVHDESDGYDANPSPRRHDSGHPGRCIGLLYRRVMLLVVFMADILWPGVIARTRSCLA